MWYNIGKGGGIAVPPPTLRGYVSQYPYGYYTIQHIYCQDVPQSIN